MAETAHIRVGLDDALERIVNEAKNNLQSKGHVNTGRLLASIEKRVYEEANTITGIVEFLDYGIPQDRGVPASKIPFSGIGGGGKSKYIQGLISWVKSKGFGAATLAEQKSIAFAIAHTHKFGKSGSGGTGMHSKGGSPAPDKAGFFTEAVQRLEPEIELVIQNAIEKNFEVLVDKIIKDVR